MTAEITDALEALHPDAFGWALHCCHGDHLLAEEALQNAYLKLASGRARFNGHSTLRTWWFGVIRLTALEEVRRLKFRHSLLGRLLLRATDGKEHHPSPLQEAEDRERAAEVRALLKQLPARQAEVLHLVFYQDLSLSEAAVVMRVSVGSARKHYERGKARMRSLLQSPNPSETP